jgi:S1-C subfamily serine protease
MCCPGITAPGITCQPPFANGTTVMPSNTELQIDCIDAEMRVRRVSSLLLLLVSLFLLSLVFHRTSAWALRPDELHTIDTFEKVSPSVVYITTVTLKEDPWSFTVFEVPQGTGSGAIWSDDGYIVTNYHVIQEATGRGATIQVTLDDRSVHDAQLVGFEMDKDVAVLKIAPPANTKLRAIEISKSSALKIGQDVLAIGTPFGLDRTLTTGIVSGLGRKIQSVTGRPIDGMIQTDAAINPGNSGGPLLDSDGKMIGMNTAIYSPSGAYAGIGFAVPVDTIKRLVPQLIKYGKAKKASLGLSLLDDYYARRLGVPGVIVYEVAPDGPAEKAGVRPTTIDKYGRIKLGDVILEIDAKAIQSADDILDILESHQEGDRVTLTLLRTSKKVTLTLQLGSNV